MVNKQESKYLRAISIMTLAVIAFLCLVSMACGMPVSTLSPETVNKVDYVYTSTQTATSTPVTTAKMTVCNSGGLNIRLEAGDLSRSNGWLNDGDYALVRIPATVTEDMGLWYQLADGSGWINGKYLCEVK